MTPAQKVMAMILENHKPLDIGEGEELRFATTLPNVTQMKAYYPPKNIGTELMGTPASSAQSAIGGTSGIGGVSGILPSPGTQGVK
jgi:hypothetical protein